MDERLVMRAQRGDEEAFEALTAADHARLFRVAHGILGDPHLAEDATQQAYLDIWRSIPGYGTRVSSRAGATACSCMPATPKRSADRSGCATPRSRSGVHR